VLSPIHLVREGNQDYWQWNSKVAEVPNFLESSRRPGWNLIGKDKNLSYNRVLEILKAMMEVDMS